MRTSTIFADAHIDHFYLYAGLLNPAPVAFLIAGFRREPPPIITVSFTFEAFTVAFVLAVIGDIDRGRLAMVIVSDWPYWAHSLQLFCLCILLLFLAIFCLYILNTIFYDFYQLFIFPIISFPFY